MPEFEPARMRRARERKEAAEAVRVSERQEAVAREAEVQGACAGKKAFRKAVAEWEVAWRPPLNTAQRMLGLGDGDTPLTTSQSVEGCGGWSALPMSGGRQGPARLSDVRRGKEVIARRARQAPVAVFAGRETPDSIVVHGVLSRCPGDSTGRLMQRVLPYVAFGKLAAFALPPTLPASSPSRGQVREYVSVVLARMNKACRRGRRVRPRRDRASCMRTFFAPLGGLRIACWCDPLKARGGPRECCYVRALAMLYAACTSSGAEPEEEWPALSEHVVVGSGTLGTSTTYDTLDDEWAPRVADVPWLRTWCNVLAYATACPGFGTALAGTPTQSTTNMTSCLQIHLAWLLSQPGCPWASVCHRCGGGQMEKGGSFRCPCTMSSSAPEAMGFLCKVRALVGGGVAGQTASHTVS